MIALESFKVHKKLALKGIQVEPKKVKATYCIEKNSGEVVSTELIYSYEHPYFDKKKSDRCESGLDDARPGGPELWLVFR